MSEVSIRTYKGLVLDALAFDGTAEQLNRGDKLRPALILGVAEHHAAHILTAVAGYGTVCTAA